jgi:hypothetical protein
MKKSAFFLMMTGMLMLAGTAVVFAQTADIVYDAHGQRDPFLPLVSSGGALINYESNVSVSEMLLEGVIEDGSGRIAIINGNVVEVGGHIGAYTVLKIEADRVVLDKDGEESVVQLKKEE